MNSVVTVFDLILVLVLFFFTFSGFMFGAIQTIGSLAGTIVGIIVAGRYFDVLSGKISPTPIGNPNLAKVLAFALLFVVSSKAVSLVFWIVNKVYKLLSFIPFLKSINRLAGGFLGLAEGVIIVGVALVLFKQYPFADFLLPSIDTSPIAQWLLWVGGQLVPLLPSFVDQAREYMQN